MLRRPASWLAAAIVKLSDEDLHARPPERAVEPARHGEDLVPNRLPFEPPQRIVVQQQVERIELHGTGISTAAHPPRAAGHDLFYQPLDAPPLLAKPHGNRIEQRLGDRIGGRFAELPKIVGGGHEAAAEEVVPDPVDDHAAGERVGGIEDPVSQFPAA